MKTKVREFRTNMGLTQQQLADLVHVSNRTIISIEKSNIALLLCLPIVWHKYLVQLLKNYVV